MVKMLLDHGWPVTQNILQEAAEWGMAAPFRLLVEAGGQLTPKMIAGGARNIYDGDEKVQLLVSLMDLSLVLNRCSTAETTPSALLEAAARRSLAVIRHLLALDNAAISEEMLIVASGNTQCTTDMLKFLWNLAPHIEVCPEVSINATNCDLLSSTDFEFMSVRMKDAKKCQEILNAVVSGMDILNYLYYINVLDLILESRFEIGVTDALVTGAFQRTQRSVFGGLLQAQGEYQVVTGDGE